MISHYYYFCVYSLLIFIHSFDFDELIKKKCVDKNEDYQRNKEHNMHACLSYCFIYYVDSCLGKYLQVSLYSVHTAPCAEGK